jgi:hypothetical protein
LLERRLASVISLLQKWKKVLTYIYKMKTPERRAPSSEEKYNRDTRVLNADVRNKSAGPRLSGVEDDEVRSDYPQGHYP